MINLKRFSRTELRQLFWPKSIAVIGASTHPEKIGNKIVYNLMKNGFPGKIYPINPHAKEIRGLKCYPSVERVPDEIDVGIISVPVELVLEVAEGCGRKGVKFLVIIASGFAEVGNIKEEQKLIKIARRCGMRILGPNIFGIYYAPAKMNATFGPTDIRPGDIALITQSGALGVALTGKTIAEEIGLSAIVGLGNKADIDEVELLEFLAEDEATKVIIIYMEGTRNGRKLLEIAQEVVRIKPIIVIKAGRSKKGARAAASHTGSLAGSDAIFDAAFKQGGILRALAVEEAFNWARALASQPRPKGKNTLIITNGGGMGVLATDESEAQKLYLLDDPNLMSRLFEDIIPQFGSLKNPIDLTGMATPKTYKQALTAALTSERIDSIIVLYTMGAQQVPQEFAEAIITAIKDAPAKPLMVAMFGGVETKEAIKILNRAKTPAYEDPEAAVRALGAIYRWKSYLRRPPTSDPEELEADWDKIKKIIAHVHTQGRLQLLEHEVKEILKAIGLEVPPYRVAHSIEECIEAADELGYPVVLKIISEDIIHKTEAGGIKLNLQNSGEVKSAYKAILASCRKAYPQAHIRGILVTPMIFGGVEVIIGVSHDPSFGPTLMFGLGGIYVEVLRDVSFRVAPITKSEAHQMISEIRSASILRGVRGELPKDIAALAEAIYRVGKMVDRMREIIELDINPMKVLDDGMGCIVLDGRMTISEVK